MIDDDWRKDQDAWETVRHPEDNGEDALKASHPEMNNDEHVNKTNRKPTAKSNTEEYVGASAEVDVMTEGEGEGIGNMHGGSVWESMYGKRYHTIQ